MRVSHKILLNFVILVVVLILFYAFQINETKQRTSVISENSTSDKQLINNGNSNEMFVKKTKLEKIAHTTKRFKSKEDEYNVWCIFTKVSNNSPMKRKFERFAISLMRQSSVFIQLHLIVDGPSKVHAQDVLRNVKNFTNKTFVVCMKVSDNKELQKLYFKHCSLHFIIFCCIQEYYYEVNNLAEKLQDIISSMQPYFSSQPGSYYSDALFFLSLGLHRLATEQTRAIMFDADTKLLTDVALLFQEFEKFGSTTLFGLAPELSPVYRHILHSYRLKYKNTLFGEPIHKGGYPGLNSGVIMFQFENIRKSEKYNNLLKHESVHNLTTKYSFKGHLGDQDFYTLLGMEHPSMIHILGCEWNRQLCIWWKNHGYQDIFDDFFLCEQQIKVYHGNCNTAIPNLSFFPF